MKIGFIGLGHMGTAMAANLARSGHELDVFNRSPGKAGALVALGAHQAASVAEASRNEIVITMLADDAAAADIAFAPAGLIASLAERAVHISMSTISVGLSKQFARAHAQAGQRYIAAPVFGRPEMAAAAQLFIVAGGDAGAIAACQPLFDAMGQKTLTIGPDASAANLVKLSGNFLQAAAIAALGEAIALVGKAGIDRRAYVDLMTSSVFNLPAYKIFGGLIAERKFEPAGFAMPLGYKDIRLTLAEAENLRVPMPLGSLLHDLFLRVLAQGGSHLDWSAIGGLATQDAGAGAS